MSRMRDEQKANGSSGRSKPYIPAPKVSYLAYHPTKDEKEFLRSQDEPLDILLAGIKGLLDAGHKLTVGKAQATGAYYASLRQGDVPFEQSICLSAFHGEPGMAVRALLHFQSVYHPNFPQTGAASWLEELNW